MQKVSKWPVFLSPYRFLTVSTEGKKDYNKEWEKAPKWGFCPEFFNRVYRMTCRSMDLECPVLCTSPLATCRKVSTHVFSYSVLNILWKAFNFKYSLDLRGMVQLPALCLVDCSFQVFISDWSPAAFSHHGVWLLLILPKPYSIVIVHGATHPLINHCFRMYF